MTVSYTAEVATSTRFGSFLKLLIRWRASIYKLIWKDLIVFLVLYYSLSIMYIFFLDKDQKEIFESITMYCNDNLSLIPLSFVLGFYVSIVMTRWWGQYMTIPWPDSIAVYVSALVRGQDDRGRVMRRTIMRYVCLSLTMMLGMISPCVKKRFPTLDYLVDAGLLLEGEKEILVAMNVKFPKHPTHWMPIVWAASIATCARKEGRIRDDFSLRTVVDELNKFRATCGKLLHYDWISIPLVYTQVVTLTVYTYFMTAVLGAQWTEKSNSDKFLNFFDHYIPFFATLQFVFYMGWLKVAESLINPFGEDDDDFEVNWLIDRNLQVSYLIVDEMHHDHPALLKDQYWDEGYPNELPYPGLVQFVREQPPQHSTAKLFIPRPTFLSGIQIGQTDLRYHSSAPGLTAGMPENFSRLADAFSRYFSRPSTIISVSRTHLSEPSSGASNLSDRSVRAYKYYGNIVDSSTEHTSPAGDPNAFEILRENRAHERRNRNAESFIRSVAASRAGSRAISTHPSIARVPPSDAEDDETNNKKKDAKNNKKQK